MDSMSRMMTVKDVWLVEYKSLAPETFGQQMARWSLTEEGAKRYGKSLIAAHYNCVLRVGTSADAAIPRPWFYGVRRWIADMRWRGRVARRAE